MTAEDAAENSAEDPGAETPLDRAMREAAGAEGSEGLVFDALFGATLRLLLADDSSDDALAPKLLELEAGPTAIAFDSDERLADFLSEPAPAAAIPGRALIPMLARQGVNLAINPGVAASESFHDAAALAWAAGMLDGGAAPQEARVAALGAPRGASAALLSALAARVAGLAGALEEAWLAEARREDGGGGLLLVLRLRAGADEAAAAQALSDTARLAGGGGAAFDLAFADEGAALLAEARRAGAGFDVPPPPAPPQAAPPAPPGSNPDAPPRLR